jgi:hypothetical protein
MTLESTIEAKAINMFRINLKVDNENYSIKMQRLNRLVKLRKLMDLGL